MRIARELGYTLSELSSKMTREELQLWCIAFEIEAEEEHEMHRKAQRR
tara:strand:+ start:377 stop:520 length:144 start_codon:yes stop_codon:yes gene_type:complete